MTDIRAVLLGVGAVEDDVQGPGPDHQTWRYEGDEGSTVNDNQWLQYD